ALFHGKERFFFQIARDGDHERVENLRTAFDKVEMAVGDGIERARVDRHCGFDWVERHFKNYSNLENCALRRQRSARRAIARPIMRLVVDGASRAKMAILGA